jgi:TonB-linked SusC/RagA family outer membrane protein
MSAAFVRKSLSALPILLAPLLPGPELTAQQVGSIAGTVVDATTSQPMPSVQVFVPNRNIGALSNAQGRFLIVNVPVGQQEVRAEAIGHATVTQTVNVTAGSTATANFRLESRAISMGEIVVTGVAAATPQAQLAFTVNQLKVDELQRIPAPTAGSMLQGKVAGANVIMGSGQPGSEPSIQLRGPTSITGSQEPLIIIDGVISRGKLSDIDPMDIATIEVVKGAAAASLYGSRAQAGVIQITTKRGTALPEGRTEITVRNTYAKNSMERLLPISMSHALRLTADGTAFVGRNGQPIVLPAVSGDFLLDDKGNGSNVYKSFQDKAYPEPTWDPFAQAFDPGNSNSTYVSVGGNGGATQYQASARFTREEGSVTFNDGMKQTNFRLNVDHRVSNEIQLSLSTYFVKTHQDVIEEGGVGADGGNTAFQALTFLSPKSNLLNRDANGEIDILGDQVGWNANPLYRVVNTDIPRDTRRLMGGIDATYSPTSWLSFQANASYDRTDMLQTRYVPVGYKRIRNTPLLGSLSKREEDNADLNASLTASITRNFGELVTRTRLRYLAEGHDNSWFQISGSNLAVADVPRLSLLTSGLVTDSYEESVRSQGLFVISSLTYKDRYILDGLGRRDGSSLFGPEERWQNYYRAAAAWRMAAESWWPFRFITEFKPRFSIGTAGGRPQFSAQYQTYAVAGGSITPKVLGNPRLKPEHAFEREIGVDAVIADRLKIQANWVNNTIDDQLLRVPLPGFMGFEAQWQNAGQLRSRTWEVEMETALVEKQDMLWTLRLNLDATRQRIGRLDVPPYRVEDYRAGLWVREGEELGSFYGLKWANDCAIDLPSGVDCSQFQVNDDGLLVWVGPGNSWKDGFAKNLWGTTTVMRGITYFWGIPIGSILDNRLTKMGKSQPDLNASLFQDFTWRNLGASFLLGGQWGAQIYNQTRAFACRDYRCPEADQAGKPEYAKKPVAYYGVPGVYARNENNTWFVEDGDFVKLREVSLRYTFEGDAIPALVGRVGLSRATVNLTGRNVKTWTKYKGFDPEVGSNSLLGSANVARIDEYFYPNFRSFGVDVELVF